MDPLLWMSMLNYLTGKSTLDSSTRIARLTGFSTDSYPNVAGSAVAAFLIPSFLMCACRSSQGIDADAFRQSQCRWMRSRRSGHVCQPDDEGATSPDPSFRDQH